jgi:hypothetical protein
MELTEMMVILILKVLNDALLNTGVISVEDNGKMIIAF